MGKLKKKWFTLTRVERKMFKVLAIVSLILVAATVMVFMLLSNSIWWVLLKIICSLITLIWLCLFGSYIVHYKDIAKSRIQNYDDHKVYDYGKS